MIPRANSHPRRLWLAAHLYLGLSVGAIFALLGLTGSLLVFYVDIDRMLNPELVIEVQGQTQPYQKVVETLQQSQPQRLHAWRLEIPASADRPIMARYLKPVETKHAAFAPLVVAVNPYTLDIINSRFWGDYAMTWIYDLHYTLLLDKLGRMMLGILGLLCMLSLASGIVLWWPRPGKWRASLALRLRSGFKRKIYDLHALSGVYGFLLLLLLAGTGVVLEQPTWFKPWVQLASPLFQTPKLHSTLQSGIPISADAAVSIAARIFPGAQLRWIETPDISNGVYRIALHQPDEPSQRFPKTQVWIDQYSGEVLASRNTRHNSAGDTFFDWQHSLHSGEAFGLTGRLLVFFVGLLPAILLCSGWIRWRQKTAAQQGSGH